MDVIFVAVEAGKRFSGEGAKSFSMEIGFWDSVKEIKEKIQKYQNIEVSELILNGQTLKDDDNPWTVEIFENTKIYLIKKETNNKNAANNDNVTEEVSPPSSSNKIHVNVKTGPSKSQVPLEVDMNDTVLKLKEKIHEMESVPVNKLVLHTTGKELHDHQLLRDCDVSDNSDIDVSFKPSPTASVGPTSTGGSNNNNNGPNNKKLKLMVLPKNGKKFPVEVNAYDNVGELRKELQKLNQRIQFLLPQDYFFIYKQGVMDEDTSFRSQNVVQGDTIEIFNGSVTGGS